MRHCRSGYTTLGMREITSAQNRHTLWVIRDTPLVRIDTAGESGRHPSSAETHMGNLRDITTQGRRNWGTKDTSQVRRNTPVELGLQPRSV